MPGNSKEFRDVSDLRVQYICEYRFFLRQVKGDTHSPAAEMGTYLHQLAEQTPVTEDHSSRGVWFRLALLLIAVISALLWVWG